MMNGADTNRVGARPDCSIGSLLGSDGPNDFDATADRWNDAIWKSCPDHPPFDESHVIDERTVQSTD
jgi:hypothetical protein